MSKIHFTGEDGAFTIKNPENYSGLYFPIAGEKGSKSAVTPNMGGDSKIDQETFLLEPVMWRIFIRTVLQGTSGV